nr:RNA polymerase sigma factor [Tissierella sp.]
MLIFNFVQADYDPEIKKQKTIDIDEELFKRMGRDDMDALDELYSITEKTMYAFSLSLTRDHQDALDLMQDTYIKVLSASHLYKPMGKPLAWMFTIAKNIFLTRSKREGKSIVTEPEKINRDSSFSFVEDLEDQMIMEGVLDRLGDQERKIVLLYAVSGMKHKEIASNLGLKLPTVLSKYRRALKKLKDFLQEKEEEVRV